MMRPAGGWERAGIILEGLAQFFITSDDARQITVRYVRPGGILGNILPVSGDRATVGVAAITDCRILEIEVDQLLEMIKADGEVAVVVLEILHRRLENLYAVVTSSAFGTVRERIAGQLLDLAGPDASGAIVVEITQQELADSVGTVREVAARALRELRRDGLVTTDDGRIVVVDPAGLAGTVGRWHPGGKRKASALAALPGE